MKVYIPVTEMSVSDFEVIGISENWILINIEMQHTLYNNYSTEKKKLYIYSHTIHPILLSPHKQTGFITIIAHAHALLSSVAQY